MRHLLLWLGVCAALLLPGCSTSTQPSAVPGQQAAEIARLKQQNAGLQDILQDTDMRFAVEPESTRDVSDGLYVALIPRVATDASRTVLVIDLVTSESPPSDTDAFPWNKSVHLQRVQVGDSGNDGYATLATYDSEGRIQVVSATGFAREYRDYLAYYVQLRNGEAIRVWPVAVP